MSTEITGSSSKAPKMSSPTSPLGTIKSHQRHARKTSKMSGNIPQDEIDKLDVTGFMGYHHEGPFDATLAARQVPGYAPVEAVKYGNNLAIGATSQSKMDEVMRGHVPLDGVASIAPGSTDTNGELLEYEDENVERGEGMDNEGAGPWPHHTAGEDDVSELGKWIDGDLSERPRTAGSSNNIAMKSKGHKKQVSISKDHGIVEYDPQLDEELDEPVGASSSTGLFSNLKKRLSVKK